MSQVLCTIPEQVPLPKVAQLFASHKLTTVPVLRENGEIIGVLSD